MILLAPLGEGPIIWLALRRHRHEPIDEQAAGLFTTLHAPAVEATTRTAGVSRWHGTDRRAMLYARL